MGGSTDARRLGDRAARKTRPANVCASTTLFVGSCRRDDRSGRVHGGLDMGHTRRGVVVAAEI